MTADIETAVHHGYVEPLVATGRILNSREVAGQLGIPIGAVTPIAQVMDLGREWYARHADPDRRKRTVREAAEIFGRLGLVDEFWEIPVAKGGF